MRAVDFPQSNTTYDKPKTMEYDECVPLQAYRGKDTAGNDVIVTCWELNKEDLDLIKETGRLYLVQNATAMVPTYMKVESPFEAEEE